MEKVRKIKYSNYKYQAYKLLNKLFLEEMKRRDLFMSPKNLEFKIKHFIPSKEYRIEVYKSGYVVCMVTSYANTSNWFYVHGNSLYPTDVDPTFVKKILTPVKELLKYSLQENVVTVNFYVDDNQIAYGRLDGKGNVIESGKSGVLRKEIIYVM